MVRIDPVCIPTKEGRSCKIRFHDIHLHSAHEHVRAYPLVEMNVGSLNIPPPRHFGDKREDIKDSQDMWPTVTN